MRGTVGALIVNRLISSIPVMLVVSIVAFVLIYITPGDPAAIIAGDTATAEDVARIRTAMGLDKSLLEQFAIWFWKTCQGDLGVSVVSGEPVARLIFQRIAPTLSLAATTIVLSVIVAVPLGTLAAWRAGSWVDRGLSVLSVLFFSLPVFLIGYFLIAKFALGARWFPIQ